MRSRYLFLLAVIIGLSAAGRSDAQQIILQKAVVASGGGVATSGTTTMYYTVGQPIIGMATNGEITGTFGFWTGFFKATPTGVDVEQGAGGVVAMRVTPNPVLSDARLELTLSRSGFLEVTLYDLTGKAVKTLYSGDRSAGTFAIPFEVGGLASGSYYVAVSIPGAMLQQPITVVR